MCDIDCSPLVAPPGMHHGGRQAAGEGGVTLLLRRDSAEAVHHEAIHNHA
jgi:hypothetical protein